MTERSTNRRLLTDVALIGGITLIVKLTAFGKDFSVAQHFGIGAELDSFLLAYLIPSYVTSIITGSFGAAFIPTYLANLEQQGEAAASRLFRSVATLAAILLASGTLILGVASPFLVTMLASSFDGKSQARVLSFLLLLLPIMLVGGLSTTMASVLQARRRFALVAVAPILTPVATLGAVIFLARDIGPKSLVVGALLGCLLESLVVVLALRRNGISIRPIWTGLTPEIKAVFGQYMPMIGGALLLGSTTLIDQTMAATLGPGSVSALGFGTKITGFVVALVSLPIGTVVLPYFSSMVAKNEWKELRAVLRSQIKIVLLATVPLTFFLVFLSTPIVRLLFERGAFTAEDTQLVSQIQALHALQIPVFAVGILGVRLLSALKKNRVLMVVSAISMLINVVGNLALMKVLGVAGIALATSIVYLVSSSLILGIAARNLRRLDRVPSFEHK